MEAVMDSRAYTDIDLSKQRLSNLSAYRRENSEPSSSFKDLFTGPCPQFSGLCNSRKQLLHLAPRRMKGMYLLPLLRKLQISGRMYSHLSKNKDFINCFPTVPTYLQRSGHTPPPQPHTSISHFLVLCSILLYQAD